MRLPGIYSGNHLYRMKERLEILLKKFWDGECSEAEKAELLEMLDSKTPVNRAEAWKIFQSNVKAGSPEMPEQVPVKLPSRHSYSRRLIPMGIAASLLLVFILVSRRAGVLSSTRLSPMASVPTHPELISHFNLENSPEKIRLADGSVVTLYPNSSLSYEPSFAVENRDLQLTGKAKFVVKKNPALPFKVKTADFVTTALGTIFLVDARADKRSSVKLLEGKVSIESSENRFQTVFLSAGQSFSLESTLAELAPDVRNPAEPGVAEAAQPRKTDSRNYFYFYSNSLETVFEDLAKHYGVKIHFAEEDIHNLTFSGRFNKEASLESILKIVCDLNSLEYTRDAHGDVSISLKQ